ncbi:group II dsDNA virus coat/capsid protein [Blyttiomyces helicus]|uniref:Group II dsDNA virus coat/capsid protein n=1 Tax=Blyttiomyces helicus TaxID=388810 RepID=A0A4P9WH90_9FUNG|nr:group II dsDNA virus coat/capsid protein [Blyttiomyces helicus]|eukprot:RKO92191.1 group II dsDNA virus coat/capsid protein [Blyttiomyces helicus]
MESMEQSFTGNAAFGRKVTCLLARNGDLIHKAYLEIDLPALTANLGQTIAWTRNLGHVLISEISVEIGGAMIDKHCSNWLTIYNKLTQVAEKEDAFNILIGNTAALTTPAATIPAAKLYVPLTFWFNRNPGLALPLIALMYHDVKINISFRPAVKFYKTSNNNPLATIPVLQNVSLYIDYIFLEAPERRMFSQMNHEYLIEQLQFNGEESYSNASIVQKLNSSHPTKELISVIKPDVNVVGGVNRWMDFTDNGTGPNLYAGNDPLVDAKIQLNTHYRISTRDSGMGGQMASKSITPSCKQALQLGKSFENLSCFQMVVEPLKLQIPSQLLKDDGGSEQQPEDSPCVGGPSKVPGDTECHLSIVPPEIWKDPIAREGNWLMVPVVDANSARHLQRIEECKDV